MPVAPSFDDLLAQFQAQALDIQPLLQFLDGDVTTAQMHGAGAMADACLRFMVQGIRDTFIDGAEGDALTALVDDHMNIQRQPATAAQVTLTFTRTGGGTGGTLAAGFTVATQIDASGASQLYDLDANVVFPNGSNGPITGTATAQSLGRAGNALPGTVTRIISTLPSTLLTVVVTNAAVAAGGNDEESDLELRVRARNFWKTLSRGTLASLEQGAKEVASVRVARATEDPSTGLVTLVVSDSDGGSTLQMISDVITELENWRAAGSLVTVLGGEPLLVDVVGQLIGNEGVDTAVLGVLAAAAITNKMRKQRQGETLYLDSIKAAALAVDPDALDALVLTTPTEDVVPLAHQIIRPNSVTVT